MRYQKPFLYFPLSEDEAENVIYVTTCNPVALYFMNVSSKNGSFVDFYDLFPRTVGNVWQPFVTVAPLGNPLKGQVLVHEEQVKKKHHHYQQKQQNKTHTTSKLQLKVC